MINLLQKALQDGTETLESLESKYAIKHKRHKEFPNVISFKYDQINSPMHEPIVAFARGHILDENGWNILAWPFQKFWNSGEPLAAELDWDSVRIQEKLDGSLAILSYYEGAWRVATSGTPDASGNVNGLPITFAELFWKTWNDMRLELPKTYEGYTFMFELMTPFNRIVVQHKEAWIALIGVRDMESGEELSVNHFVGMDWPIVKEFKAQSKEALNLMLDSMNGLEQEGFVCVDKNFNRQKLKAASYVQLHHMRGDDGPTPKRMLGLVLTGESSEVLANFPEWREFYEPVEKAFNDLKVKLLGDYIEAGCNAWAAAPVGVEVSPAHAQKVFASFAVKTTYPPAMFALRAGKTESIDVYLRSMQIDKLMRLLELK